jgi:hypothetical protein
MAPVRYKCGQHFFGFGPYTLKTLLFAALKVISELVQY